MADYVKTNWQNGDVITAEKLNNIEDGISRIRIFVFEFTVSSDGIGHWRAQTEPGLTATDLLSAKWIAGPYADSYIFCIPRYYDTTNNTVRLNYPGEGANFISKEAKYNIETGEITFPFN